MTVVRPEVREHIDRFLKVAQMISDQQAKEPGQNGLKFMKESLGHAKTTILQMMESEGASQPELNAAKLFLRRTNYKEDGTPTTNPYDGIQTAALLHRKHLAHVIAAIQKYNKVLDGEAREKKMLDGIRNPLIIIHTMAEMAGEFLDPNMIAYNRKDVTSAKMPETQRQILLKFLARLEKTHGEKA